MWTTAFFEYLEALKAQGVVRHIGLHPYAGPGPEVLDTGLADMMFSINPSYDYQHGEYASGSATERMALTAGARRRAWASP